MRSKINLKTSFPSSLPPSQSTSSPASHAGRQRMELWPVHHTLFLLLLRERSPLLAPVWDPSHGRQFSMNFSDLSLSHGQQRLRLSPAVCEHLGAVSCVINTSAVLADPHSHFGFSKQWGFKLVEELDVLSGYYWSSFLITFNLPIRRVLSLYTNLLISNSAFHEVVDICCFISSAFSDPWGHFAPECKVRVTKNKFLWSLLITIGIGKKPLSICREL